MLSICCRYLREGGEVVERFVSVVPVVSTTAECIHAKLIEEMGRHNLDPSKIVAASFDGASNFSGSRGGVQAYSEADTSINGVCPLQEPCFAALPCEGVQLDTYHQTCRVHSHQIVLAIQR